MTREQFVEKRRHFFAGLVLDAFCSGRERHGSESALWLSKVMERIDKELSAAYEEIRPEPIRPTQQPAPDSTSKPVASFTGRPSRG